jgi:hypothetical protein
MTVIGCRPQPAANVPAVPDAGEILTVQRAAYLTEAQRYRNPYLPPLTETLDQVREVLAGPTAAYWRRGSVPDWSVPSGPDSTAAPPTWGASRSPRTCRGKGSAAAC